MADAIYYYEPWAKRLYRRSEYKNVKKVFEMMREGAYKAAYTHHGGYVVISHWTILGVCAHLFALRNEPSVSFLSPIADFPQISIYYLST